MSSNSRCTSRSSTFVPFMIAIAFTALLAGSVLDSVAQVLPIQADPTVTPTPRVPEEPEGPDGIVANPTQAPTDEPIDDFQANPTQVPPDESVDDVTANPTEPSAADDEAIATAGTVRVIKRDCPPRVPEDGLLSDYLQICTEKHDGVEFVLNDVNGAQPGTIEGWQVDWTGVDPGVFNITETVPDGYGDPIVFCGYTESPGGGIQHPSRQESAGGVIAGTFPDAIFEYACYWLNVPEETGLGGADDFVNAGDGGLSSLTIQNRGCSEGWSEGMTLDVLDGTCFTDVSGVTFEVTHANGSSSKPIVDGQATWLGLPLVPYTIDEAVPAGYGDPLVSCAITAFGQDDAWLLSAHELFQTAVGGVIELEFDPPGDLEVAEIARMQTTCTYYNFPLESGAFVNPTDVSSSLTVRAWTCPGSAEPSTSQSEMEAQCALASNSHEFTLITVLGESTKVTNSDLAFWGSLAYGPFSLQETIPTGFGEPVAFCGWTAFHEGIVYDAFPQLVPSPGGLIEGEISVPNTSYFCDVFNIHGQGQGNGEGQADPTQAPTTEPIDDVQGNPVESGTLTVHKWDCPPSYDPLSGSALDDCTESLNGILFDLVNHAEGAPDFQAATGDVIDGAAVFDPVPGTYSLKEQIPDGYGQPFLWNCTGLDNPAVPEPPISTINFFRIVIDANQVIECDWMNVPVEEGLGGANDLQANPTAVPTDEPIDDVAANPVPGTLTINLAQCNPDSNPEVDIYSQDVEYFSQWCSYPSTEFEFAVVSAGGFAETATTTGFTASFAEVPVASITITETVPDGWNVPMTLCWSDLVGSTGWQTGGEVAWSVQSGEAIECLWVNVIGDDSHVVTVGNLACPEGVDPTDDYWVAIGECDEGLAGVAFTLTTDAGQVGAVTDAGGGAVWVGVSLGDSGEIQIAADVPDGYGEPEVWCLSYPDVEPADPFDHVFTQEQVHHGTITATPERHEPFRFACVLFNIVDDGPGQGNGQGQGDRNGTGGTGALEGVNAGYVRSWFDSPAAA